MIETQERIKGFSKRSIVNSLNNRRFKLVLFPTEQCNFRCVYCYEDFEVGKMSKSLVDAVKMFVAQKVPNLDYFALSWFGGEPLLTKDILFEISEYTQKLAAKHNCKLVGNLTTNGLLLDVKTLRRLVELQQNRFQISIDGDKDFHDQTRITKSGRGSFDRIWARLLDAANTDLNFKITLRVHITDVNQESVLDFCQRYDETLASDGRFKLFFKAIENLGGDNVESIDKLVERRTARSFASELTQRYLSVSANDNESDNYICYASKPNSIAIRADGTLNKCTVALNDEQNNIGKINEDGSLSVNNQRYSSWIKGFSTLDHWQLGCPYGYMKHHTSVGDITIKKIG